MRKITKNTPSLATLRRQARKVRENAQRGEVKWSKEMTAYLIGQLPADWPQNTDGTPRLPQRPRNFKGVKPYPNPIIDRFDDETPRKRTIACKNFEMPEDGLVWFLDACAEVRQELLETQPNNVDAIISGNKIELNWYRVKNISEAHKVQLMFTEGGSKWRNASKSRPVVQKRGSEMLAALKPSVTISAPKVIEPVVSDETNLVERKQPVGRTKMTMSGLIAETLQDPMSLMRATC